MDVKGYGEALFLLTEERGSSESVLSDITLLKQLLAENPEYYNLADTPALSTEERVGLISSAFQGIDEDLCNLLKILCEKRLVYAFTSVCDAFTKEYDESRGIMRVTCVTAVPMSESQAEKVKAKIGAKFEKTVELENIVDPKILGGMTLRANGKQLDGSLKSSLENIEKIVKGTTVP